MTDIWTLMAILTFVTPTTGEIKNVAVPTYLEFKTEEECELRKQRAHAYDRNTCRAHAIQMRDRSMTMPLTALAQPALQAERACHQKANARVRLGVTVQPPLLLC